MILNSTIVQLNNLHYFGLWLSRYDRNKYILVLCSIRFKKTAIAAIWFFFSLIIFACRIMIIIIPIDSVRCRASNFSWHVRCLVVWVKTSLNIVRVTKNRGCIWLIISKSFNVNFRSLVIQMTQKSKPNTTNII